MSRSRKKTPIAGMTNARSEKQDKRNANRKLRRKTRADPEHAPLLREVSNVWTFDKDGKIYLTPRDQAWRHGKWLRK